MLNFCGFVVAILKMETGRNFSMSGINTGRWNRTMLNLCGIVVAILKMATGRNFLMSGINSGHHYVPTYQILMISDNVEILQYWGRPFWKWRPVEIFQCRESIQDVEQCWICAVLWWPFWKWRLVEIFWCQESFRDIIIYPHMKCRWNRTMLNLCGIVAAIYKKGNRYKFFYIRNHFGTS